MKGHSAQRGRYLGPSATSPCRNTLAVSGRWRDGIPAHAPENRKGGHVYEHRRYALESMGRTDSSLAS